MKPRDPQDDPRVDPQSDPLLENLRRVEEASPEGRASDALRDRILALGSTAQESDTGAQRPDIGPAGEGSAPSPACYNAQRSSQGEAMSLQACTKCGAQFDVSSFTPGQQFTCGACGTVLTAGGQSKPAAPARRTPGSGKAGSGKAGSGKAGSGKAGSGKAGAGKAPARRTPGKAPARGAAPSRGGRAGPKKVVSGGPGAPSKGPQYQPVKRGAEGGKAKAPAPKGRAGSRAAPSTRRSSRRGAGDDEGGRPVRSSGPNKGLLIGVGVVIVGLVVGLMVMGGDKKKGDGAGGGTEAAGSGGGSSKKSTPVADVPSETAKDVMAEYVIERPTMLRQYKKFINRLKVIDGDKAQAALRTVYEDFIEGPGRDNKEARKFLGYMDFPHEIPEDISFRRYPYLAAVEAAYRRRWFAPDEKDDYETAMKAWKETEQHREKLINDHRFRAADQIRANISRDKNFKDYNYAARWSDPHLICYASKDRISEYDLLSIEDKEERKAKRAAILKKQAEFEIVLDEKQAIYQGLYKYFMDEYKDALDLKPLMDPWGGRPDYPGNVRSYRDGAPVVVWIFDSRAAFDEYHQKVAKEMIPHNVAGYFSPRSTYVFLYDEGNTSNRTFEINKNVHEGMHQLEFWFTRQRNRWSKPKPGQDFFGEGIAEFIGAVKLKPDHTLEFLGVNVPRLKNMQDLSKTLDKRGGKYELFPVDKLVGFMSYGEVQNWGSATWGLDRGTVLGMFYQQSWAFVYFMNKYKNGKYKDKFLTFFNLVLHKETGGSEGDAAFREAFRIRDEDDWEDINDEFHDYLRDVLMKMDTKKYEYTPPPRGVKK